MSDQVLFLCYFGLREPLVQTQVLPYLREINKLSGVKANLLTFEPKLKEKWTPAEIESEKQKLAAQNIEWHLLPYHKTPSAPATLYDVIAGSILTRRLIKNKNIRVLHGRSHVATMIGAIARIGSRRRPKLLFDIRGFFPEEYTDAGNWKENGWLYKTVKVAEKWLLRQADGFVVLTEKARTILFPESTGTDLDKLDRPVEVIPCCVDFKNFEATESSERNEIRAEYGLDNRYVITYVGSLGTWYLTDEMADFMQIARKKNSSVFALILTQSAPEIMTEKLKERGFTERDFLVKRVSHDEIHKYLSVSDVALSFIKPCFSKQSSSPTKVAEYLASGVPVVTNRGVGDIAEQIESDEAGAVIENFNREDYETALKKIEILRATTDLSEVCRQSARKRFDVEKTGGEKYRKIYKRFLHKVVN